jgi:glycosyltransferase involved in cell wall biosynthesis
VIAARAGALPEVVGDAALLVDPRSVAAIADAMDRLGREPALLRDLAAGGPERAAGFRWDATAAQVMEVLRACS